jgi:DNA-binding response OmpR family regulator
MKTQRLSMDSSSSVREPAGKKRQQKSKQQHPSEPPAFLRPSLSASNGGMTPRSSKDAANVSTEDAGAGTPLLGTVLFVSDDDYFRTTVRAYLEHVGLAVRSCADAARVPELFFSKPAIDLLLVDVHAIGSTGLLLAAELTAFADDLPVIIISNPNGESTTSAVIPSQGWKFLSKPVLLPELLETIHAALGTTSSPEAWNTRKAPLAVDDASVGHSRRAAVSTDQRRSARRPSRLLVMQGTT